MSAELIVADREQSVRNIEFVRLAAGIEIDVVPIIRFERLQPVPQRQLLSIEAGHDHVASVRAAEATRSAQFNNVDPTRFR